MGLLTAAAADFAIGYDRIFHPKVYAVASSDRRLRWTAHGMLEDGRWADLSFMGNEWAFRSMCVGRQPFHCRVDYDLYRPENQLLIVTAVL
jgi:hypothetical protein